MEPAITGWRIWSTSFTEEAVKELEAVEKTGAAFPTEYPKTDEDLFGIQRAIISDAKGNYSSFNTQYIKSVNGLRETSSLVEYLMGMILRKDPRVPVLINGVKDVTTLLKRYEEQGLSFYGLSVLSLSIIFRCEKVALAIIERVQPDMPINTSDKAGWTALHHAAANKMKAVRKSLKSKRANNQAEDNNGITPSVLKKMRGVCKEDENYQILFRRPGENEDCPILASELIRDYGHLFSEKPKRFLPYAKVSKDAIYDYWKKNNEGWCKTFSTDVDWMISSPPREDVYIYRPGPLLDFCLYYSSSFKKNRNQLNSSVALRIITKNDLGKDLKVNVGVGVYATGSLPKGTSVVYYGGKYGFYEYSNYLKDTRSDYNVCGKKNRSLGSCVAHSLPNAKYSGDGIYLVQNVEKDEQICVNYNGVFRNFDPVVELRPKALEIYGCKSRIAEETEEERFYVWTTATRSLLVLILKGIYNQETDFLESGDSKKCIDLCFQIQKRDKELAFALSDHLIYQNYNLNNLESTLLVWDLWKGKFSQDAWAKFKQANHDSPIVKPAKPDFLSTDEFEELLKECSSLNKLNKFKEFLIWKLWKGDPNLLEAVKTVRSISKFTVSSSYFGLSVLSLAIILGHQELALAIIERAKLRELKFADFKGKNCMDHALRTGQLKIVQALNDKGLIANSNDKN